MTEKIVELARALGRVEDADLAALEVLCAAAEAELRGRLRPGVKAEDCAPAFVLAAAWTALAGLVVSEPDGVERFSAGDVSIQERGGGDALERSAALRIQAGQVMGPYLRDEGFAFRGVRG